MLRQTLVLIMCVLMSACGGVKLNPFSEKGETETDLQSYICDGNKAFQLRMLNQRKQAWLVFDDHEVYLTRQQESGQTYANDRYLLKLGEEQATLSDTGEVQYEACRLK